MLVEIYVLFVNVNTMKHRYLNELIIVKIG